MNIAFSKLMDAALKMKTNSYGVEIENKALVALALVKRAIAGDMNAIKLVMEYINEKELERYTPPHLSPEDKKAIDEHINMVIGDICDDPED